MASAGADDPATFYTGIVAELYGPLRGAGPPDPAPYAAFVRRSGEPALELGCGDGDPLLDLRAEGLHVEGLDSSPDMLERCRTRAAARGLDVVLHERSMADIGIGRRFRSIYLAGPTFNLLPDDATAGAALASIADHLADDGTTLVPLFVPEPTPPSRFGIVRTHRTDDGVTMGISTVGETFDADARTRTTVLRYERTAGGRTDVVERPWVLHWYERPAFEAMAAAAGLRVVRVLRTTGGTAGPDDTEVVFLLSRRT